MSNACRSLIAVSLLSVAGMAVGQAPPVREDAPDAGDGAITQTELDQRAATLARAKFEASRASVRELARARLEAARGEYEGRYRGFFAGRGTLDFLLAASQRCVEAELALAESDAARLAALERYWTFSWVTEAATKRWYDAGRLPIQDYLLARYYRLDAEIRLLEARARGKPGRSLVPRGTELLELTEDGASALSDIGIDDDRKLRARARFEALRANPGELAGARIEAARRMLEERFKEFCAGRGTLDFLLDSSQRWLEAELVLAENDAVRFAAYERHWRYARESAEVNQYRYEAGRIPIKDLAESQYVYLQAQVWLDRARARRPRGRGSVPIAILEAGELGSDASPAPGPSPYARAKWDAAHPASGELRDLLQRILGDDPAVAGAEIGTLLNKAKRKVALTEYESRRREFEAGRGTLTFLLNASLRVLESEQDISTKPADQVAALDRHSARLKVIDDINQVRYRAGRVGLTDKMQSRYFYLDAEIRLADARVKQVKK